MKLSQLMLAIESYEKDHLATLQVRVSNALIDPVPLKKAKLLFISYKLHQSARRDSVLIYVNLRISKVAFITDEKFETKMSMRSLKTKLEEELQSSHHESALCRFIEILRDTKIRLVSGE